MVRVDFQWRSGTEEARAAQVPVEVGADGEEEARVDDGRARSGGRDPDPAMGKSQRRDLAAASEIQCGRRAAGAVLRLRWEGKKKQRKKKGRVAAAVDKP